MMDQGIEEGMCNQVTQVARSTGKVSSGNDEINITTDIYFSSGPDKNKQCLFSSNIEWLEVKELMNSETNNTAGCREIENLINL